MTSRMRSSLVNPCLDEALAERLELALLVRERGVLHERLGELLLAEAAGLDEARAQLLVGDGQGDALHAARRTR